LQRRKEEGKGEVAITPPKKREYAGNGAREWARLRLTGDVLP
jgi:hypothetical protein